jgi:hypothetical protein
VLWKGLLWVEQVVCTLNTKHTSTMCGSFVALTCAAFQQLLPNLDDSCTLIQVQL